MLTHLYLFTYLITPRSRVLPEKLMRSQLVKKLPTFYGTWNFIAAFTSVRHMSLSWARSIQSIPLYPTSGKSILILFSHLHLGLPSDLFPSGFYTKTLYTVLLSSIHATCPAHPIRLELITWKIFGEKYRLLSSTLCSFLHSPVISFLLGPSIFLSTQFSNTLSIRSSLSVTDQVSSPYTKQQAKINFCISSYLKFIHLYYNYYNRIEL